MGIRANERDNKSIDFTETRPVDWSGTARNTNTPWCRCSKGCQKCGLEEETAKTPSVS